MATVVDYRCPKDKRELFGRRIFEGAIHIVEGNLMEFACDQCKRTGRKFDPSIKIVKHRFQLDGEWVEDVIDRVPIPRVQ